MGHMGIFGYALCCDYGWNPKRFNWVEVSSFLLSEIIGVLEIKINILISARVQMDFSLEVVPDQPYHLETTF